MTDIQLFTTDEAAERLRVSTKTVLRLIKDGRLPAAKVGRSWRIRDCDLPCLSSDAIPPVDCIYLDDNASNPLAPEVRDAMVEVMTHHPGNASSGHAVGSRGRALVERARQEVANRLGASKRGVIFTSGATEANNLALRGLVHNGHRIIISAGEHDSVTQVAAALASDRSVDVTVLPLTDGGEVDLQTLEAELSYGGVGLVSIVAANGETGVLNDVSTIASLVHAAGALFHSDATQWVGRLPWSLDELGVDAMSVSAHKMCGPQGVGALLINGLVRREIRPQQTGGGHEGGLRSGSHNVAGIVGFGVAAELAASAVDAERQSRCRDELERLLLMGTQVERNGTGTRLPNTSNLRFVGVPNQAILARCPGIAAATGSACHAGALDPSPTLQAMGLSRDAADESLRFSVTRWTTLAEVESAVTQITSAVEEIRELQEDAACA